MDERLTDEEIDAIQEDAYRALRANGYSGGMGCETWDRASARSIEAAVLARAAVPAVQPQEPVAWMWQHDETGMTGFVQHAPDEELRQWERMNRPRKIVTPLYATPQARQEPSGDLSAVDQITDENRHGEAWPDGAVAHIYQGGCPDENQPDASDPECPACSARSNVQRHITDMLVAHRDMIEAQQRGDSAAEVLAVQRMEAARSAVAGVSLPAVDLAYTLRHALDCIKASTEYRQGNPAFEYSTALLTKAVVPGPPTPPNTPPDAPPNGEHSDHPMRHYDRTCPGCNTDGAAIPPGRHTIPSDEQIEAVRQWLIKKHACWFTVATLREMFAIADGVKGPDHG